MMIFAVLDAGPKTTSVLIAPCFKIIIQDQDQDREKRSSLTSLTYTAAQTQLLVIRKLWSEKRTIGPGCWMVNSLIGVVIASQTSGEESGLLEDSTFHWGAWSPPKGISKCKHCFRRCSWPCPSFRAFYTTSYYFHLFRYYFFWHPHFFSEYCQWHKLTRAEATRVATLG